jgi:hypothetical protein
MAESASTSSLEMRRSKICAVCGDTSDTFHLNYNASACLSCRAFFRRIVQKSKADAAAAVPPVDDADIVFGAHLACKKGTSSCEVTVKTRIKCQKCRFDACMAANMDPACVLDEDRKRSR